MQALKCTCSIKSKSTKADWPISEQSIMYHHCDANSNYFICCCIASNVA